MLWTARTLAYSADSPELIPVWIFIWWGKWALLCYYTAKKEVKLEVPEKRNLIFWNWAVWEEKCNLVQVILQGREGADIEINVLIFPSICMPPTTTIRPQNYVQLEGLELADHCEADGSNSIDILILLLVRWREEMVQSLPTVNLVGYCLGQLTVNFLSSLSSLALQDPYSTATQGNKDEHLDHLQQFWYTESLVITEESSADKEFEEIIHFDDYKGWYIVYLPWTFFEVSSTNYGECLTHLNLLRTRLLKDELLL